jgi:hypothetical protein
MPFSFSIIDSPPLFGSFLNAEQCLRARVKDNHENQPVAIRESFIANWLFIALRSATMR